MWQKIGDTVRNKPTDCGDDMGCRSLLHPLASMALIGEEEVKKYFTRHPKANASMKVTALRLKWQCKLTILMNGCLPPTYHVYKEITCFPRLVKSKGIPIRKGSRKIRPKETPKRKRLIIQQGDVNTLLLQKPPMPSPTKVRIIYPSLAF